MDLGKGIHHTIQFGTLPLAPLRSSQPPPPHSWPQATTATLPVFKVLAFLKFPINGILQHVIFLHLDFFTQRDVFEIQNVPVYISS